MATVPSSFNDTVQDRALHATRQIRAGELVEINQNANYLYSRSGVRGTLLSRFVNPWSTTSTSYTTTDSSATGINLSFYESGLGARKKTTDGSGTIRYEVTVTAIIQDADLVIVFEDIGGTASDKSAVLSSNTGGTAEAVSTVVVFTEAEMTDAAWLLTALQARAAVGETGYVYSISFQETLISSSDMP